MIKDPRQVIERLFKVELKEANKEGIKIIPFKLNRCQAELDAGLRRGPKHVVLKARQLGISTYVIARFLAKCLTVEGTHAVIISHERQATVKLLRKAKFFIDELRKSGVVVKTDYDSKAELTFPELNSSLYIGTAGQKAFSRGDTLTDVHGSEVAFWEGANDLMRGVMGALTPNAEVILESTANGAGGYFFDMCQKAMAGHADWKKYAQKQTGESEWKFHFYPWTDEPAYTVKVPANHPLWTPEERALFERGVTLNRLMWRRKKLEDYRSVDDFLAEFPLTPDEAFIVTGSCYFDKPTVRLYQQRLAAPPVVAGQVEMVGQQARFNRFDDKAPLSIWEYPRPGMCYLISADCSEGIDDEESDESVAQVLNRTTFKQVAVLAGRIDPVEYAAHLYALGGYYGWAWLAVEDNGPGLAVLLKLKEMGYPRIYYHRRLDVEAGREVEKIGWRTDQRTRTPMLAAMRSAIKKHQYYILDERLLRQCTTFCRQADGGYRANSGCHDDHVMSAAIGVYVHGLLPMDVIFEGERGQEPRVFYRPVEPPNHGSGLKAGY